jgi:hypothetical protein
VQPRAIFKSLHLSRSALGSHVAEHFDLRDTRTVKPCARCLFLALFRLRTCARRRPFIALKRKSFRIAHRRRSIAARTLLGPPKVGWGRVRAFIEEVGCRSPFIALLAPLPGEELWPK